MSRKILNKGLFVVLLLGVASCSNSGSVPESSNASPNAFEVGEYVGALRMTERAVNGMLDYCAEKFPERASDVERAKLAWSTNNEYLLTSERQVLRNWFAAQGVQEQDISAQLEVVEQALDLHGDVNPAADTIKLLESETPARRMQVCGYYVGFVIGGGQDIKVIKPHAQSFYEKYSYLE